MVLESLFYSLALLSNAKSHAFSLSADTNEACDAGAVNRGDFLNAHVKETVFLKLALSVEVADNEATLLILVTDSSHHFDVESLSKEVNILSKVSEASVDLDLVLPFIVSPFLFEIELSAIGWLEFVDKVNLYLVEINDVRNVSACRIKGEIAVDSSIVS